MTRKPEEKSEGVTFVTEYTNRWGKRMVAADYGYKAWRFAGKRS